ncbi:MAG: conjugal transfer protein TraH, partial [Halomonadaceae bacterium]|nr:conjugal transfer protein TraH [Halomonadaceae bacterium]
MIARKVFKRTGIAGAVGLAIALSFLSSTQAEANSSLRNEMNKMFGTMSNATSPGVFETSRRGVISGGSIVARNKIMNTNIVSFQPPSFNAGCGGIDFFGGSFSFI